MSVKQRVPITSSDFVYRDSAHTDLRKTFAEERKRLQAMRVVEILLSPGVGSIWIQDGNGFRVLNISERRAK